MPRSKEDCCDHLAERQPGVEMTDVADLAARCLAIPSGRSDVQRFRCRSCGQIWEQHWGNFMHAITVVLLKEGITAFPPSFVDGKPVQTTLPGARARYRKK